MKKFALVGAPMLLILALALGGCGKQAGVTTGGGTSSAPGTANTIGMTADQFSTKTVTAKVGTPVHFDDSVAGGGYHIVCVGKGQTCDASGNGPAELYGKGITFNNGDKKDITFSTAGTYTIICTVHQNMVMTLTVQ